MNASSAWPNGYTCPTCGLFVAWSVPHECASSTLVVALERIAAALEGALR